MLSASFNRYLPLTGLLLAFCTAIGNGQEFDTTYVTEDVRYPLWFAGIYGGVAKNAFTADMRGFPGVPSCCPQYRSGNGLSIFGGLSLEYPLSERWQLGGRLAFEMSNGTFESEEQQLVDDGTGPAEATIAHTIRTSLPILSVQPTVSFNILQQLWIQGGVGIHYYAGGWFEQEERFLTPAHLRFENDRRTRMIYQGSIPERSSVGTTLSALLRYHLPLNKEQTLFLAPEVGGDVGLNEIVAGTSWQTTSLRFGLSLRYHREKELPVVVDTLITPRPVEVVEVLPMDPVISVLTVENGAEKILDTLTLENVRTISQVPLLTHIFFDEGSADIPSRYHRLTASKVGSFSESEISGEAFDVYYQSLNVLGQRLQQFPDAELTLTGCNADVGAEKGNRALSQLRVESVRSYLIEVWGVDSSRIHSKARNLPAKPSPSHNEDGRAENRRVEFASNDPRLVYPVTTSDTTVRPDRSVIWFEIEADSSTTSWVVEAKQGERVILQEQGTGIPPQRVPLALTSGASTIQLDDQDIQFGVTLTDKNNKTSSQRGAIKIHREQRTRPGTESYWMIVFGYNSRKLGEEGLRTINGIKAWLSLRNGYVDELVGQTDRTGNPTYNQNLSKDRAAAVALAIKEGEDKMRGVGNALLEYPNDLPEGRYYSRNVKVIIRTDE